MKRFILLVILIVPFLFYQCKNDQLKHRTKESLMVSELDDECTRENVILNQIFPSLFDSINSFTKIKNNTILCYSDSLLEPRFDQFRIQSLFIGSGIQVDTILFNKYNKCKLSIKAVTVNLMELSPHKYLEIIKKNTDLNYLLFEFTRICFNKQENQGFLNFSIVSTPSSGRMFSVLIEEKDNKWIIQRIILSGII